MMTLDEIKALIASGENESKYLEFKAAAALLDGKGNELKKEISKDVSSFANAAGGKIIYGVAEEPLRLDPFDRKRFSPERLEQLIKNNIAPKIPDIRIQPIPRAIRSDVSSHFSAPVDSQMLEVFTFSNAEKLTEEDKVVTATHPVPLLPHRALLLGWITLFDGSYYEESKSKGVTIRLEPPFDTLYWKVYCDEGRPSSGEYSLRELAGQYDEFRSKYER